MTSETALPAAAVGRAISHMNADHRDSLLEMAQALAGCPWATDAELSAIDALGVEVRASGDGREEVARITFATPLAGAEQLRDAMIALARRARGE